VLNIGVIGAGNIGYDHIQRVTRSVAGARIAGVFDVAVDRAKQVADQVGAVAVDNADSLITDERIEAVIIASPGPLHAEQVLACLAVGKPVLCEKPLATTIEDSIRVLDAEVAVGRRLVQVGFMRRYDPGYRRVKEVLRSGGVGEPLLVHSIHRNPTVPDSFTSDMSLTDSVVHEMDTTRWLFGEEVTAVTVVAPRRSPLAAAHLQDPQMVFLETESGILVDVESFVGCQYGYDVRCEVVGSTGTVSLDTPTFGAVTSTGVRGSAVPADWRMRFGDAYRVELQEWVDTVATGTSSGPTAWDGYAATAIAVAAVQAQESGSRTDVKLIDKPALYA
jgi:myo-inositol 2-dehydrogenase/D-chiro-inositol 1-dehydrogenase